MGEKEHVSLLFSKTTLGLEAGCDEAGRGCLAGPVVAAAVILGVPIPGLNDSKKLLQRQRETLRTEIERTAIAFAVAYVSPQRIDEINILNASIEAMHQALSNLQIDPKHILVDGNRFRPFRGISHDCIVGGDARYQSIAAASILAKTYRDEYMAQLDQQFPQYGWKTNQGYPTKTHVKALTLHGITRFHRKTYRPVQKALQSELF